MQQKIDIDHILERFDQTDPKLQREIVAMFAARATFYGDALNKIASVETRPQDANAWPGRGLIACRNTAREALEIEFKFKRKSSVHGISIGDCDGLPRTSLPS